MVEFDVVYKHLKLRVFCTKKYEEMIKKHLNGHVKFKEPIGKETYRLCITDDENIKPGLCSKIIDKWFNYATADCYIDNDTCYLNNIKTDGEKNLTLMVQYFAANVFNRLLEIEGYIGLHSSCVEKDGNGIIFVGGRNSGKTNCMLNMMHAGYNSVTNDKSAIIYDNGLIDYGIAQSVSIRLSKSFREQEENKKYEDLAIQRGIKFTDENKLEGNNIILNDIELAELNNVNQVEDTVLRLFVNPIYNPYITKLNFRPMLEKDVLQLIHSQLLPLVHETTFFLRNINYSSDYRYSNEDVINKLKEIPCYYCEQNQYTTKEFVEKIKKLVI